jgi:hypothetical protein
MGTHRPDNLVANPALTPARLARFGLAARAIQSIQRWHAVQLATFWAACVIVPWQFGFWRHLLVARRLEPFLNPGAAPTGWSRAAGVVAYVVIPLGALLISAIWIAGRTARRDPGRR